MAIRIDKNRDSDHFSKSFLKNKSFAIVKQKMVAVPIFQRKC